MFGGQGPRTPAGFSKTPGGRGTAPRATCSANADAAEHVAGRSRCSSVTTWCFRKTGRGTGRPVELWDQCRLLGVSLPQASPVSPSAMCNARAKVDENLFRVLNAELLRRADDTGRGPPGRGRLFAVDGSKLNLPRPLIKAGYRLPSDNAHYPQGLLSCLYRLRSRVPVDFDPATPTGRSGSGWWSR